MNTEQLGAEFEAWCLANGYSTDGHEQAEGRREGYFAAAKSRDELIGKLYKALELARKRVEYLGIQHPSESHYLSNIKDFLPQFDQALAEAKAQGYDPNAPCECPWGAGIKGGDGRVWQRFQADAQAAISASDSKYVKGLVEALKHVDKYGLTNGAQTIVRKALQNLPEDLRK